MNQREIERMNNNNNFEHGGGGGGGGGEEDTTVPFITSATTTIKQEEEFEQEAADMWLQKHQQEAADNDLLIDLNHASSFFYDDDPFPTLPDFTCMSSSSSSSPPPPPPQPQPLLLANNKLPSSSSSSSSNASWTTLWRSDSSDDKKEIIKSSSYISTTQQHQMDMDMDDRQIDWLKEDFGYMDVKDPNDIWNPPSSIFQQDQIMMMVAQDSIQQQNFLHQENGSGDTELSAIFLDWLKQNKDGISANDLRCIKLKRSTIESASKRLGNGKQGKKNLLKLILQWVEHNHLQKNQQPPPKIDHNHPPHQDPLQNPNPNPGNFFYCNNSIPLMVDSNNRSSSWPIQPPPAVLPYADRSATSIGYASCTGPPPYSNGLGIGIGSNNIVSVNGSSSYNIPPPSTTVPMMDSSNLESVHDVCGNSYAYQVFNANGERLLKPGPLATKEARKKRMARNRRLNAVHHRRFNQQNKLIQSQAPMWRNYATADDNYPCSSQAMVLDPLLYWSQAAAAAGGPPPPSPLVSPHFDHEWHPDPPGGQDQGLGHKTETNLRFLLQKVLKQSDVGNLGRIVLPKKEAELHLPELHSRDGIPITIEDIGTSNVWTMRYRFWPNNNSRMYLLENTGGFVRLNSLQEGDFIVLYSEIKSGKYLIRGVKVRPTTESKPPECKKAARKGRNTPQATTKISDVPCQ